MLIKSLSSYQYESLSTELGRGMQWHSIKEYFKDTDTNNLKSIQKII